MEILMTVLAYLVVFGAASALAVVPGIIAYFVSGKRMSKLWSYFVGVVVVLSVLASFSQKPVLLYRQECTQFVTQEQDDLIRSVSSGAYSVRMPLIPLVVYMDDVQDDYIAWTEYYFPGGTREMEYSKDGFNCTKQLLPWA